VNGQVAVVVVAIVVVVFYRNQDTPEGEVLDSGQTNLLRDPRKGADEEDDREDGSKTAIMCNRVDVFSWPI